MVLNKISHQHLGPFSYNVLLLVKPVIMVRLLRSNYILTSRQFTFFSLFVDIGKCDFRPLFIPLQTKKIGALSVKICCRFPVEAGEQRGGLVMMGFK